MSDDALKALADAAGLAPRWKDYRGTWHDVTPDTLRSVLRTLDLPADSEADVRASTERLHAPSEALPPLLTLPAGAAMPSPRPGAFRLVLEDGEVIDGRDDIPPIQQTGYHRLEIGNLEMTVAVTPHACVGLPAGRPWGIAAQLYSLRRDGDAGIGDFAALSGFVKAAARHGADAVAISPVHAQFSADPDRFSPYAPSSRIMLNVLHADAVAPDAALERSELVDWPAAARLRLAQFRAMFDRNEEADALAAFRAQHGETLESHARFEALHAHFFGADPSKWNWRSWPDAYRSPASPEVAAFAATHAGEVAFHAYLQFLADRGLAGAQAAAKAAGMRIGLISDLAVGTDGGGSHAWSRQDEMLIGLGVGAPPDLLNTQGQNWGITAFSPRGLRQHGYGAFIEMLRAALRHAGGVRIDHVMGLARLWVVPDGASSGDGAYLHFPVQDLLRLTALESHRHGAIVLGEDLGTVPEGFQDQLISAGLLGMRVLWFERARDDGFIAPGHWSHQAVGMTSTHDLATTAGWWSGRDIFWRHKIGLLADDDAVRREEQERARDRAMLWDAMRASGAAVGDQPAPDATGRATDAACAHVARAACGLAMLPLEDVLGRIEQPNLPGTLDEHPNWRRRMDGPAEALFDASEVAARLATVAEARK